MLWKPAKYKTNDFTGFDNGEKVARIYQFEFGPQEGRWYWSVFAEVRRHVPNKQDCDGQVSSEREAKEAAEKCYAKLLERYQPT